MSKRIVPLRNRNNPGKPTFVLLKAVSRGLQSTSFKTITPKPPHFTNMTFTPAKMTSFKIKEMVTAEGIKNE